MSCAASSADLPACTMTTSRLQISPTGMMTSLSFIARYPENHDGQKPPFDPALKSPASSIGLHGSLTGMQKPAIQHHMAGEPFIAQQYPGKKVAQEFRHSAARRRRGAE